MADTVNPPSMVAGMAFTSTGRTDRLAVLVSAEFFTATLTQTVLETASVTKGTPTTVEPARIVVLAGSVTLLGCEGDSEKVAPPAGAGAPDVSVSVGFALPITRTALRLGVTPAVTVSVAVRLMLPASAVILIWVFDVTVPM